MRDRLSSNRLSCLSGSPLYSLIARSSSLNNLTVAHGGRGNGGRSKASSNIAALWRGLRDLPTPISSALFTFFFYFFSLQFSTSLRSLCPVCIDRCVMKPLPRSVLPFSHSLAPAPSPLKVKLLVVLKLNLATLIIVSWNMGSPQLLPLSLSLPRVRHLSVRQPEKFRYISRQKHPLSALSRSSLSRHYPEGIASPQHWFFRPRGRDRDFFTFHHFRCRDFIIVFKFNFFLFFY